MVGEGLIYAELGTAAFILAEADAQYQAYVATLPEERQAALAQAEADLRATDRPLNADFLAQSYDDDTRAKREAAMQIRQNAWAGANIQANAVLQGAQDRQIQYYRQGEMDRIVQELIDNDPIGATVFKARSKRIKKLPTKSPVSYDRQGLPRVA